MKKTNILYLLLMLVFIVVSVTSLTFGSFSKEILFEKAKIVGALLSLSSVPHLLIFCLKDGFKNKKGLPYGILGFVGLILGVVFMYLKLDLKVLNTICLVWGIFDIVRSLYELFDIVPHLFKKEWLESIEVAISLSEIVIAILLIIERFGGIKLHFIYLGISFIIYFAKYLFGKILVKEKNEKSFDCN